MGRHDATLKEELCGNGRRWLITLVLEILQFSSSNMHHQTQKEYACVLQIFLKTKSKRHRYYVLERTALLEVDTGRNASCVGEVLEEGSKCSPMYLRTFLKGRERQGQTWSTMVTICPWLSVQSVFQNI